MEPNWKPLEMKVGPAPCVGFMFMGKVNGIYVWLHLLQSQYSELLKQEAAHRSFEAVPPSFLFLLTVQERILWAELRRVRIALHPYCVLDSLLPPSCAQPSSITPLVLIIPAKVLLVSTGVDSLMSVFVECRES